MALLGIFSLLLTLVSAELLQDIGTQVVTYQIGIPDATCEQALHPVRGGFSGLLGQLPAIFALDAAEEALQVAERPTTGFWPGKARGNPGMQLSEGLFPLYNVSERRSGSHRYGMLVELHGLLLSLAVSEGGIHMYRVSHVKEKITKLFSWSLNRE